MSAQTILVIEDSDNDAELIRIAFRKAGFDHPVEVIGNPRQGLSYLKGEEEYQDRKRFPFPALVMLDHKVPGDGWPVIEWIRHQRELALLPVVVFSGSDDPAHQKKARDLGANAYHIKPQNFEDFIEIIRRIGEFWLREFGPGEPDTA